MPSKRPKESLRARLIRERTVFENLLRWDFSFSGDFRIVSIRVPSTVLHELDEIATLLNTNRSVLIRVAIYMFLSSFRAASAGLDAPYEGRIKVYTEKKAVSFADVARRYSALWQMIMELSIREGRGREK
jgi:predicted transcriptional regulator